MSNQGDTDMTSADGKILTAITAEVNSVSSEQLDELSTTMRWGTFGPTGNKPMQIRFLNDLETDHLENILVTQKHIDYMYSKVILHLIKKRLTTKVVARIVASASNL